MVAKGKAKAKSKAVVIKKEFVLPKPVQQADVAAAEEHIKDDAVKSKARNSFYYWLASNGMKESYDAKSLPERRDGMLQWLGTQLENERVFGKGVTENTTLNRKNHKTSNKNQKRWRGEIPDDSRYGRSESPGQD